MSVSPARSTAEPRPPIATNGAQARTCRETGDVRVDVSSSTATDIEIRGSGSRWVRLTGRHPDVDAAALVASRLADAAADVRVMLIGPALGHIIEAIFAQHPQAHVVALEPDPEIARHMLARRSWQLWIDRTQLAVLVGPDYAGTSSAWRVIDGSDAEPIVFVNPVIECHWEDRVASARRIAARIAFDRRANADARSRFAGRYVLQTLDNLPVVAQAADVGQFFARFAGVPAIVVGAGPSLDRTISALARARDRALVIAVDTALRPLLAQGIEPDLAVAVDPADINARHLTDLPANDSTWLVAEPSIHPSSFDAFDGRTTIFRVASHQPWPWLKALGVDCATLRTWGSVITSAFDLAVQLGCDPIVFVGADLAYTDGQTYCRGTIFEEEWAARVEPAGGLRAVWNADLEAKALLSHPDLHGRDTRTSHSLIAFRDWIVERASELTGRRIINATGAGILRGGRIEQAALSDLAFPERVARPLITPAYHDRRVARTALAKAIDEARAALDGGGAHAEVDEWRRLLGARDGARLAAVLDRAGSRIGDGGTPSSRHARVTTTHPPTQLWPPERRLVIEAIGGSTCPEALRRRPDPATALAWLKVAFEALAEATAEMPSMHAVDLALAEAECCVVPRDAPPSIALPLRRGQNIDLADLNGPAASTGAVCADDPSDLARAGGIGNWIDVAARASAPPTRSLPDLFTRLGSALGRAARSPQHPTGRPFAIHDVSCRMELTHGSRAIASETTVAFPTLSEALVGAFAEVSKIADTREVRELHVPMGSGLPMSTGTIHLQSLRAAIDGAFDRAWMVHPETRWVNFRVLAGPPFEPCSYAAQLPNGAALLVGGGSSTGSHEMSRDGAVIPREPWPSRIAGEVPWGSDGGAVAWHGDVGTTVFVRRSRQATVETYALPGYAFVAHVTSEGGVVWPTLNAGVWEWRPDRGCQLLVDAPPVMTVRTRGSDFEFDPMVVMPGPEFPPIRLNYTWAWTPGASQAVRRPVGPEGQSGIEARSDGWAACPFIFSDLVRISTPHGRLFNLHVPQPLTVAWVGSTLLVTTSAGVALLFDNLFASTEARRTAADA
jgi:hypothetical protein